MTTSGTSETRRMEPKAKVFICYSRTDLDFADRIVEALKGRGFEGLIDRSDILPSEPWLMRIENLIAHADTVVFVISPEAISSQVCKEEVKFAASLNKRFIPIVLRRVSAREVPKQLSEPQWIFFDDPARFDASVDELSSALQTDIEWIRKHTEFGEHARRWDEQGRGKGATLRGADLEAAERWLDRRPADTNAPTDLHQDFVRASRRAATTRQRYWVGGSLVVAFIAIALAGFAEINRRDAQAQRVAAETARAEAQTQRAHAETQTKVAETQTREAERQRNTVFAQLSAVEQLRGNFDLSLKLAVRATSLDLAMKLGSGEPSLASAQLASAAWASDWRLIWRGQPVYSAAFSPERSRIVIASYDKTARILDGATGRELAVLRGHEGAVMSAAFSPDGRRIVTASVDGTARIWDAETGKEITELRARKDIVPSEDSVSSAAFSPDGSRIVTASEDNTARIWDVATGKEITELQGHGNVVFSAAFSPDGSRIVTAASGFEDNSARIWDATSGHQLAFVPGPTRRRSTRRAGEPSGPGK
jgi:hypothetical protein